MLKQDPGLQLVSKIKWDSLEKTDGSFDVLREAYTAQNRQLCSAPAEDCVSLCSVSGKIIQEFPD